MNQREENHEKIWSLIKDARVAMLTTTRNGRLYSRPMVASQRHFDGILWFFTRKSSPKVDEVAGHHEVNVAYASAEEMSFVSLAGRAILVDDVHAIDEHWNQFVATWFPGGKDDPDVALLRVDIETAEYWDAPSSKMAVAFDYIKARVTGSQPDVGDHGKLDV
ncbi:pyridoxamine 5'-phosphate oxidase family protein [Luteibacter aegosomatissinici]|uniref:pyridoxamine 5'-phosphate oxidase family protein n=1 Tax=Luteibacter aegosomatissinici TaxID=2911539 RepID=UPI001FFB5966|nr:pyridoxamine 5'-phosphate oxidase family protein [Luteibacter aegosomatissinici]UPG96571.1 pyridoxamine 5'-phosphate oxidase family protein [Luteibacter aegosomatissinici]